MTALVRDLSEFLFVLKTRNETLFYFGLFNLVVASGLFLVSRFLEIEFAGSHALYKPIKFALSTTAYSWATAWFCYYLNSNFHLTAFNWGVILLLGFEVFYITLQAFRQMPSHYNISTPVYSALYVLMAVAASLVTLWTAYVGILFLHKILKNCRSTIFGEFAWVFLFL